MKTLVETIAKALVDDPTQVNATEDTEEDTLVIKLTVAKEDMGRIIGKEGRTAKAIRTILNAVSTKDNKKAILKIVE
ncbi:MAG: KH domain-containing protein [Deltaproteobacteria bacterium]|nr:KH domain-containing protein [Deltaproteobacteria bacterium]